MKQFTLLLLFFSMLFVGNIYAQCPFPAGVTLYGTGAAPTSCIAVTTGTSTCHYFTEYGTFTGLTIGNTYTMQVVNTTTVTGGPYELGVFTSTTAGTVPLAYQVSPTFPISVTFVATTTQVYTKAFQNGCLSTGTLECNTYYMSCVSCPAPVVTLVQPSSAAVVQGTTNTQVLRIDVPSCTATTATTVNCATTGCTAPLSDIAAARLYYTTTTTFATTVQFGAQITNPNGAMVFTGSQALPSGTGYFWLVYDLKCNAIVTDIIDAECTSVVTAAGTQTPAITNPTGSRAITAAITTVSTNQPLTSNVNGGTTNNVVLRVDMPGVPCAGNLTQLNFTNPSTNLADVVRAKVFYTTTTTFSAAVQFGSDVINPGATFTVNGSLPIPSTGTGYFHVIYELACAAPATAGNVVDAGLVNAVTSVTGTITPATSNPVGTRTVVVTTGAFLTIANGDWSSPSTWSCGAIPPLNTTAVTINTNVTVSTAVMAGNVTVIAGASLTVSGGSLTLGASSAGAAVGNSNKLLSNSGTLTISGGTLEVNGGVTNAAGSTFNMSGGTLNIDPNDGTATSYTTNAALYFLTPNINVTGGNINILDPSYGTAIASQRVISYNFATTNASFGTGCTVTLGGGDDINPLNTLGFLIESVVSTGMLTIGTLVINGGTIASGRHSSVYATSGYATAVKNLTVNAGSEYLIPPAGAILGITGNLINNGVIISGSTAAGNFSCLAFAGAIIYSGGVTVTASTTAQSISGTGFFKKTAVELNPTAQSGNNLGVLVMYHTAASPGLTLNMPITATSGLRLADGKINTTSTNFLALGHGTSIPGNPNALVESTGTMLGFLPTAAATSDAYDGGWINGPLKRWFSAVTNTGQTGFMPVGFDTTNVAQVQYTVAPSAAGYLTATWIEGSATATFAPALNEPAVSPSTIDHYKTGIWDVVSGVTGGTYTANFTDSKVSGITSFANTTMIKRATNVSNWALDGTHVATIGSNVSLTMSRTGLTAFSQFGIGSGFGPMAACTNIPLAVNMTAITSSSAQANWTAPSPAPSNGYDYFVSTLNTPPIVSTTPTGNTAGTNVVLSLSPNTTYYFWVRSNCGGSDVSAWTSIVTFMTLPGTGCTSTINSNIPSICIGNNVILSATGTWVAAQWYGPSGILNGQTSTTLTLNNIQIAQSGAYSISLTDGTGCMTTAVKTITVNPLPVPTIGASPNPVCTGATLNLSSSGGSTYSWSGPSSFTSTSQNPTRAAVISAYGGLYTVTVTSAAGCTATASTTVTVNTSPTVTANAVPNPVCTGSTLNLSSTGGGTYIWTGPAAFNSTLQNPSRANVLSTYAGVYTVSVTAGGCSATKTVTVVVNPSPVATASAVPNAVCAGSSINLKSSGGGTYAWSGPAGFTSTQQNPIRSNALTTYSGIYTVTVTSALGCSSTASVTVTVNPTPSGTIAASPSAACVGSTVQLSSSGGTSYAWTGPLGYTSTLQNPVLNITTYQQAGVYKVKVSNASMCSVTYSVTITVNYPPISTATYNVGSNCIGSNLSLHGTGGGTYSWSGPAGFTSNLQHPVINNVSAANSGVYTLIVTSPNGCSSVSTLSISILAAPVVTATADSYTVCEGSTAYLHATGGTSYSWTGPFGWVSTLQHPVIQNIPMYLSGTYTVKVTNAGGCSTTASFVLTVSGFINGSASANPNPAPSGSTVQLSATGGTSYLWTGPNGFFSIEQNPVLSKVSSRNEGTYAVILTNEGKCQMTLFVYLSIIGARESGTGINVKETKVSELSVVYPNPAKNMIKLDYNGSKSLKYNIVNAQGEIIVKDARSESASINIENLSSGTYAIVWSENSENAQTFIGKFIKVD